MQDTTSNGSPSTAPEMSLQFGPLLFQTARMFDELAQRELNRSAGERIARPSIMRLLPFLGPVGVRPTDLAKRVDVSKQAVGQAIQELEARGLVEYCEDPTDRRVRLVRLTSAGEAASQSGRAVLIKMQAALAADVGAADMAALVAGLGKVLECVKAWEKMGSVPSE